MFLTDIKLNKCVKSYSREQVTLESVPDCYKNQQMCNKAVDNQPHALKFVPDYYMPQKTCDKAVKKCFLAFFYIPG